MYINYLSEISMTYIEADKKKVLKHNWLNHFVSYDTFHRINTNMYRCVFYL